MQNTIAPQYAIYLKFHIIPIVLRSPLYLSPKLLKVQNKKASAAFKLNNDNPFGLKCSYIKFCLYHL